MQTDTLRRLIQRYTVFTSQPVTVDTVLSTFPQIQVPPKKKERALGFVSIEDLVVGKVLVYTDGEYTPFRKNQRELLVNILHNYPGALLLTNNNVREQTYAQLQEAFGFEQEETLRAMALGSAYELWSIRSPLSQGRDRYDAARMIQKNYNHLSIVSRTIRRTY